MPPKPKGSNIGLKLVILLLFAGAGTYFALSRFRPVAKVVEVRGGIATNVVEGNVIVTAKINQPVVSDYAGRILKTDFNLEPGKLVKADEPLARINDSDIKLRIKQTGDDLHEIRESIMRGSPRQPEFVAREEAFKREEILKTMAPVAFDQMKRELASFKASIDQEINALTKAEVTMTDNLGELTRQLGLYTIKAEFDGMISEVFQYPGAQIAPGQPIAQLISTERVVEASIGQENLADIRVGQSATVEFDGRSEVFRASVSKVFETANPETQRYKIHLKVEAPASVLIAGISGNVHVTVGQRQAQAIIPRRALSGNHVFVVFGGTVEKREVTRGFASFDEAEILGGLKAGEQVIVEYPETFRNGQHVKTESVVFAAPEPAVAALASKPVQVP